MDTVSIPQKCLIKLLQGRRALSLLHETAVLLRDGEMTRIYKFELLNNMANLVVTLFISIGLFGFDFFRARGS
jgi:hypothetical protein